MGLQDDRREYRGICDSTGGYMRVQWDTLEYREIHESKSGYEILGNSARRYTWQYRVRRP